MDFSIEVVGAIALVGTCIWRVWTWFLQGRDEKLSNAISESIRKVLEAADLRYQLIKDAPDDTCASIFITKETATQTLISKATAFESFQTKELAEKDTQLYKETIKRIDESLDEMKSFVYGKKMNIGG